MKKVMVVYSYGSDWDYDLYLVSDKVASRIEGLLEEGECVKAYELVCKNDRKTEKKNTGRGRTGIRSILSTYCWNALRG